MRERERVRPTPWELRRSSLVPLVRTHAANAAADALIAVSLADTFFFDVPLGTARGRVALYLLITVAPFAVVAPVIGPLLDRLRSGRRYALAISLLGRGVLAWVMAGSGGGLKLYPAAFAVLVLSKGYGVAKAAAVPRLLPEDLTLVAANARMSATALVSASVAGLLGAGVSQLLDFSWTLRLAALVFVVGTAFALALPSAVNSEGAVSGERQRRAPRFLGRVRWALLGAAALRALAGFLTMFLAFLLRQEDSSAGGTLRLGLVIGAAAVGGLIGTFLGSRLRDHAPDVLLGASLGLAAVMASVAALSFSLGTAAAVALASGLGGALGKLAYDAVLQHDIDDDVRGQVFARSETTLQLGWVAGGVLGIALPLRGALGLGLAATGLVVATVAVVRGLHRTRDVPAAQLP